MTSPANPLETTIGKYRILELAGEGAMGAVYRARDTVLNRMVAVKVMNATIARDPELRDRFLREAQSAGSLQHPNVVTIFDFGEVDGHLFIAMEYVEGTDLGTLLADPKGMTLQLRLELMIDVLAGLEYAHQKGIVHRDLKPANIRVTPEPRAKLMDFGVAGLESSKITKTGMMVGTPSYMAPEYISGKPATTVSDIFSIGAVLYEVLTGRQPFLGETLHAVLFSVVQQQPPSPTSLVPSLPKALDAIVYKALAKNPADRYAKALDLAQALTGVRASLSGAHFLGSQALSTTLAHRIASKGGAGAREVAARNHAIASDTPSVAAANPSNTARARGGFFVGLGIGAVVVAAALIATFQRGTKAIPAPPSGLVPAPAVPSVAPATAGGAVAAASPDTVRNAPQSKVATELHSAPPAVSRKPVESPATRALPRASTSSKAPVTPANGSGKSSSPQVSSPQTATTQSATVGNSGAAGVTGQGTSPPVAPPATSPVTLPPISQGVVSGAASTNVLQPPSAAAQPADIPFTRNVQAELREVINGYARAISSRDLARVRVAFPGVSREQLKGFADYFAQCKSLQATFALGTVDVHERAADGTVNGSYECNGKAEKGAVTFRATFERDGDRWHLASTR